MQVSQIYIATSFKDLILKQRHTCECAVHDWLPDMNMQMSSNIEFYLKKMINYIQYYCIARAYMQRNYFIKVIAHIFINPNGNVNPFGTPQTFCSILFFFYYLIFDYLTDHQWEKTSPANKWREFNLLQLILQIR